LTAAPLEAAVVEKGNHVVDGPRVGGASPGPLHFDPQPALGAVVERLAQHLDLWQALPRAVGVAPRFVGPALAAAFCKVVAAVNPPPAAVAIAASRRLTVSKLGVKLDEGFRDEFAKLFAVARRAFEAEQVLAVLVGVRRAAEFGPRFLAALVQDRREIFGLLVAPRKFPGVRDGRLERFLLATAREEPVGRG